MSDALTAALLLIAAFVAGAVFMWALMTPTL